MIRIRFTVRLVLVCFSVMSGTVQAAVSDWYGTWQTSYAGADAGTCTVNIGAGNATQASVSMSCVSSVDGTALSASGSITATGSISIAGGAGDILFIGTIQGDSGSGQWTNTTFGVSGSWTNRRVSAPQPVAVNPNQPAAAPPAVQTAYSATTGRMPSAAVTTDAGGTLGSTTLRVTLDLSKVLSGGSFAANGQFAAGYNIYVVALVPAGVLGLRDATWLMLSATTPNTHAWAALSSPVGAYMEGVAQGAANQLVQISILQNLDVTGLLGTEFYLGYGTSDMEMLLSGRYRGVYIVR